MLQLNKAASRAATHAGATAATDVTGFGLLGHALNIAKGSGVTLTISGRSVPFMQKVFDYISVGVVPKGARKNLDFFSRDVTFRGEVSETEKLAFADPQTSGGLLITLPEKGRKKFDSSMKRAQTPYWIIGTVQKGKGRIIIEQPC